VQYYCEQTPVVLKNAFFQLSEYILLYKNFINFNENSANARIPIKLFQRGTHTVQRFVTLILEINSPFATKFYLENKQF